jgi:hypothetical protein|nr:MAG TPA: hypothetical protein [Caudoviricetes sp.]
MSKSKKVKEIKDAEVIVDAVENEETVNVQATEEETVNTVVNEEEKDILVPKKKKRLKTVKEFWNDYKKTIITVVVTASATVAGTLLVKSVLSDNDKTTDIVDAEFTEKDDNDEAVFVETE